MSERWTVPTLQAWSLGRARPTTLPGIRRGARLCSSASWQTILFVRASRSLPVLVPQVPRQRWSCHSCGNCCRSLVIHLSAADRARIDEQSWPERGQVAAYVRAGRGWVLNKRADGACVFLDEDNKCQIHAKYGAAAKPLACRLYPFSVRPTAAGWQASLRFDCPSMAASEGDPIGNRSAALAELAAELPHRGEAAELADFQRGLTSTIDETEMLLDRYVVWLLDEEITLLSRLIGAARVTATLEGANFKKVRGKRFAELLELLFAALPAEAEVVPTRPTDRQCAMLRQLTFAHAEHVSLGEVRAPRWQQLKKRWQQLNAARRFLAGRGRVPRLPGDERDVEFDAVESVGPSNYEAEEIEELLMRYVVARLRSRSVFGNGYYGWRIFAGLTALWISISAVGWLARYKAAQDGRTTLSRADAAKAIAIVDAAATRLPVLGSGTERARGVYVAQDDGVARLLQRYSLCGEVS